MNNTINIGYNSYCFCSNLLNQVAYMLNEHYKFIDTWICINGISSYGNDFKRGIYYNLEHKYPLNLVNKVCNVNFLNKISAVYNTFNYILDFQIENYEYFANNNLSSKFRFQPLRYTSIFEKYDIINYYNRPYDLHLEAIFDTNIRRYMYDKLTNPRSNISTLISYTYGLDYDNKIKTKLLGKYAIDIPHYDYPQTINCFRIWEYSCLNMPVIVIDDYNITSSKYFDKNIVKTFTKDVDSNEIKKICSNYYNYGDINQFKQLTYSKNDYDNYRIEIIKDFYDKTHTYIPDSVLLEDFHD